MYVDVCISICLYTHTHTHTHVHTHTHTHTHTRTHIHTHTHTLVSSFVQMSWVQSSTCMCARVCVYVTGHLTHSTPAFLYVQVPALMLLMTMLRSALDVLCPGDRDSIWIVLVTWSTCLWGEGLLLSRVVMLVCVCMCVCVCVCVCVYPSYICTCMCIYIHIHIYVYMYVKICIHA